MVDTSRIEPFLTEMKKLDTMCMQCQIPLTMEEKQKLLEEHAKIWHTIMHSMSVQRICANCEHCVLWESKYCCAARDMAPIPFEIVNRVGGCSKWYEKDYIPF